MKYLVKTLFAVVAAVLLFSCGNKNQAPVEAPEEVDPREDQTMVRSGVDTMAILHLVNDYLTKLQENKIDSALDMLYEADGDTVVPLSAKGKSEILETLKSFPVLKYQIKSLNMFSEQDTEVRYIIEYFEKKEDNPMQNTLQCVINPRRVGYYWYLTVPQTTREPNYDEDKKLIEKQEAERAEELREAEEARAAARAEAEKNK